MVKHYFNTGYLLAVVVSFLVGNILIIYFFEPLVNGGVWVVMGANIFFIIILVFLLTRSFPIYVKISGDTVTFWGVPWKHILVRSQLDDVVIEPTGIIFLPKKEYVNNFRTVANFPGEEYEEYKVIKFANYKAIGALIDALKPVSDFIYLDKVSPKWRKYFEEKMYGDTK